MVDEETRNLYASPKPNLKGTKVLDTTQEMLGKAWAGARTVDDWRDPFDVAGAAGARTVEGGLKAIGTIASTPGIRHTLEALDTPIQWVGDRGGEYLESKGIDPRFAHIAARGADLAIGGAIAKGGLKIAKMGAKQALTKASNYLQPLAAGMGGTGAHWAAAGKVKKAVDGLSTKAYENYVARRVSSMKEGSEAWHSFVSTPPGKFRIQGEELVFNRSAHKIKGLTQHHEVQKAVSSRITQKMRQFVGGDPELMHYMDEIFDVPKRFGLEAGSGRGAIKDMNKPVHTIHHGRAQRGTPTTRMEELGYKPGLQPSGDHLKQLYNEIDNVKSPEELIALYEDFIETSSLPLVREAELLERAYAKLELGQLPDEKTLMLLHKEAGLQLDSITDLRIDKLHKYASINDNLKIGKKTKPTQFPERIQKHINRSKEIGITEPVWKDGSLDFTWRPATNTGQIDIPAQSLKTFKGLRDEFFEKIENLPSGSVWELNPQFKDAKRRRIYAKLFEGDHRITRNADETLGWILKVP